MNQITLTYHVRFGNKEFTKKVTLEIADDANLTRDVSDQLWKLLREQKAELKEVTENTP